MKRILSYILIFCILLINFSCRSTSLITKGEIGQKKTDREILILKAANKTYELRNYKLESEYIEGDIYRKTTHTRTTKGDSNFIVVILDSDYSVIPEEFPIKGVQIPDSVIEKIEYKKLNTPLTILTVTAVLIPIILIISNNNWSWSSPFR